MFRLNLPTPQIIAASTHRQKEKVLLDGLKYVLIGFSVQSSHTVLFKHEPVFFFLFLNCIYLRSP